MRSATFKRSVINRVARTGRRFVSEKHFYRRTRSRLRANVFILESVFFFLSFFPPLPPPPSPSPPPPPAPRFAETRLSTINTRDAEKTRDAFVHLMALVVALLKDTYVTSPFAEVFQRTTLLVEKSWQGRGERVLRDVVSANWKEFFLRNLYRCSWPKISHRLVF